MKQSEKEKDKEKDKEKQGNKKYTDGQLDFVVETIKKRPIDRGKLARRTLITAMMAVLFGGIACLTFLLMEPVFSKMLTENERVKPNVVTFPEDSSTEEMSPEEMLTDLMQQENYLQQEIDSEADSMNYDDLPLTKEQVDKILSQVVCDRNDYRKMYSSISAYVKEISKSLVTVTATSSVVDWMDAVSENEKTVSGVIIANNNVDLLVLVDYSTFKKSETLSLTYYDGSTSPAELKAIDSVTEIAILSTPLESVPESIIDDIPIAVLGSSNSASVGSPVVAVGSPLGYAGTVGYGIVSGLRTSVPQVDSANVVLQTDIVGPKNGSGFLFNLQGQLIGIITNSQFGNDVESLIASYGISNLKSNIEKMSNGSAIGYLGITGTNVTREAHNELNVPFGAYVLKVDMDSPAMMEGVQTGDIIVQMNSTMIISYNSYVTELQGMEIGDTIRVVIKRQVQDEYKDVLVEFTVQEAK